MHWPDREINTKVTTGTSFFDIKIYILEFSERDLTLQSNCQRIVCTISRVHNNELGSILSLDLSI